MMKTAIGRRFTSVLVLAAFLGADLRLGYAYPGDVFRVSTPAQAPSIEDRLTSEEETHSVGESGTAHYTIPITVPPGRQGMQPSLSLSYSSRNPVRGGLAAGWTLNIPKIEVDTSQGRLAGTFYRSSLSGTRLVLVQEQALSGAEAFRAEFDGTYARYERVKNPDGSTRMWIMRSTDGRTWFFGEAQHSQDAPRPGAGLPAPIGRWFLSKIEDRFGNFIEYSYARAFGNLAAYPGRIKQPVDVYPTEIKWGANAGPAVNLPHYARIVFDYDQNDSMCAGSNVPIGASFTYRQGYPLHEGAKRLTAIVVQVSENGQFQFPGPERRRYNLGYDMVELGCPTGRTHAPLRLLTSVQQIAFAPDGKPTALPLMTFEYGRRELELTQKVNLVPFGEGHNALSYGKAGGWPTMDGMLLDFDGDGRLDPLGSEPKLDKNGVLCGMSWSRNKGDGTFENKRFVFLPTVPWAGPKRNDAPPLPESFGGLSSDEINAFREELNTREGCSLSHQFSRVDGGSSKLQGGVLPSDQAGYPATYNSYRFMDVTGDGRPDLVTAIDTNRGKYHPESDTRLWPPSNPYPACFDYGPCRDQNGKSTMCSVMAPTKMPAPTSKPTSPPGITSTSPDGIQTPLPTKPVPPPGIKPTPPGGIQSAPRKKPVSPQGVKPSLPMGIRSRAIDSPPGPGDQPAEGGKCPLETCIDPNCGSGRFEAGDTGPCMCSVEFCEYNKRVWDNVGSPEAPPLDFHDIFEIKRDFPWSGPRSFGDIGNESSPAPILGNPAAQQWPEFSCGRNVLRVYENTGSDFASQAKIVYSPIPLETDRETSALGAGHLAASSSWHGFLDIDGDGFLDAVYNPPFFVLGGADPAAFKVFRGDGTGNFRADSRGNPYEWPVPIFNGEITLRQARIKLQSRGKVSYPILNSKNEIRSTRTMVSLQDLNGDGLPDYVDARFSPTGTFDPYGGYRVHVFYNTGRGFSSVPVTLEVPSWGNEIYRAFEENQDFSFKPIEPFQDQPLKAGLWSRAVAQVVDIDVDGLPDLVLLSLPQPNQPNPYVPNPKGPSARLFVNVGDKLVPMGGTAKIAQWWSALARITIGRANGPWNLHTDFVDLDGDGLPEAYINTDPMPRCVPQASGIIGSPGDCLIQDFRSLTSPRDGQGMRLLRKVNNGRGGTVQFDYEPLRAEPTAGPPSGLGTPGGRPGEIQTRAVLRKEVEGRVPYPLWVVKSVTVHAGPGADGVASPPSITEYSYQHPIYNQDNHGDWGFRGFTTVKTKSPSGAVSFTHSDYSLHWGGLPVQTQVFDADNGHAHLLTKTVWSADPLFNNRIITHHRREVETRTCRSKQNLQACATTGDPRFDIYQWQALSHNAGTNTDTPVPVLYAETTHWASDGRNLKPPAQGTKWQEFSYLVLSRSDAYRLLPGQKQRWVMAAQPVQVGQTLRKYDPDFLMETETVAHLDPKNVAVTAKTYDRTTGNVLTVTKPNEVGKPTPASTKLVYDARRLFVIQTINELGHQVEASYDLGTGVQLSSRGPNDKQGVKDGWERKIDGFGRLLEERVYLDAQSTYAPVILARNTYVDVPNPQLGGHAGVYAYRRIELDQDRWTLTVTELDGMARVVASTTSSGQSVLSVSRYIYDAAGHLAKAHLPAPNKPPGTVTVPYSITYDPQGRRIKAIRPDQTGQRWIYDGRFTTREDLVVNKNGVVSRTRTLSDAFDRLIQTEEQLAGANVWASTRYIYDGNDNVMLIKNADNITTEMEHDWLSHRVRVTRGGQTWRYLYDKNGNMTKIFTPAPAGANPEAYAVTIAYDALDRPITRLTGHRALTKAQLIAYGGGFGSSGSTKYGYDTGVNGNGRLASVSQPTGTTTYSYEARGLVEKEDRTFSILNGQYKDSRSSRRTYNALGQLRSITYADGIPKTPPPADPSASTGPTTILFAYDDRGLPNMATWQGRGELGQAKYSASGAMVSRWGMLPNMTTLDYTHDILGRVTTQRASARPPGAQALTTLAEQRYSYTGSDDVAKLDVALGPGSPPPMGSWTFTYDPQHQLVGAAGLGYEASFSYSAAGRILTAAVNAAQGAARIYPRTVSYDYAADDPEAPDVLKQSNGTPWMTVQYDLAGNATQRTIAGQPKPWIHIYDGADLQREVIAPDGTRELYWYDHGRQRVLIATLSPAGTVERVRWVFGETEIWYDGAGKVEKTLANVSLNGMLARIEDRNRARFLFQAPRGDLLLALDQQGSVAADFTYGPYGELVKEGGADRANVLERFNGKQFDQASGLAYYGYRYYDERSLTWTQADPLYRFAPDIAMDQPRRFATYAFSLNNPMRYLDPDGRDAEADMMAYCEMAGGSKVGCTGSIKRSEEQMEIRDQWDRQEQIDKAVFKGVEGETEFREVPKSTWEQIKELPEAIAWGAIEFVGDKVELGKEIVRGDTEALGDRVLDFGRGVVEEPVSTGIGLASPALGALKGTYKTADRALNAMENVENIRSTATALKSASEGNLRPSVDIAVGHSIDYVEEKSLPMRSSSIVDALLGN